MQTLGQQQLLAHGRLRPILLLPVPRVPYQPSRGAASSTGPDPAEIQPGAGQGAESVQSLPIRQPSLPPRGSEACSNKHAALPSRRRRP